MDNFLKFLILLKNDDNQSLIESIQEGYQVIMESVFDRFVVRQIKPEEIEKARKEFKISTDPQKMLNDWVIFDDESKTILAVEARKDNAENLRNHYIEKFKSEIKLPEIALPQVPFYENPIYSDSETDESNTPQEIKAMNPMNKAKFMDYLMNSQLYFTHMDEIGKYLKDYKEKFDLK